MAHITAYPIIRRFRADISSHIQYFSKGRKKKSGRGLSFLFLPAGASITEVPMDDRELPFMFNDRTADHQSLAAAYTAVDAAEDDTETAMQVNGVAPGIFAGECVKRNIPLVHVSTDYVFPGNGSAPVKPDTPTDPLNAYGMSKLSGELAVINSGARAAILRTAWVFDGTGKNFMTTMLRLAKDRMALSIVADQVGQPTYAPHLADACLSAMNKFLSDPKFTG